MLPRSLSLPSVDTNFDSFFNNVDKAAPKSDAKESSKSLDVGALFDEVCCLYHAAC